MSRISLENKSDSWETRIKRNADVETSHFDPQTFLKAMKKLKRSNATRKTKYKMRERQLYNKNRDIKVTSRQNIYEVSRASLGTSLQLLMRPFRECLMTLWRTNVWGKNKVTFRAHTSALFFQHNEGTIQ